MAGIATTTLSTKGQLIVPKAIRDRHHWKAGTRLKLVDTPDGLLVRAEPAIETTKMDDIFGSLKWDGPPASIEDMNASVLREARRQYAGD